jgi:hypothetical protein
MELAWVLSEVDFETLTAAKVSKCASETETDARSRYGLTVEKWNEIFDQQRGMCECCGFNWPMLDYDPCLEGMLNGVPE